MASAACVRRVVRSSLGSSSCRVLNGARSTGMSSSSPSVARFSLLRRQSNISRLPRVLGPVSSLMPLHTATATALMTSMLSVKSRNWGWLSETHHALIRAGFGRCNKQTKLIRSILRFCYTTVTAGLVMGSAGLMNSGFVMSESYVATGVGAAFSFSNEFS
ncbi:unnamed protein product [Victoria cruziana]